jgi:hypothetical protein
MNDENLGHDESLIFRGDNAMKRMSGEASDVMNFPALFFVLITFSSSKIEMTRKSMQ